MQVLVQQVWGGGWKFFIFNKLHVTLRLFWEGTLTLGATKGRREQRHSLLQKERKFHFSVRLCLSR